MAHRLDLAFSETWRRLIVWKTRVGGANEHLARSCLGECCYPITARTLRQNDLTIWLTTILQRLWQKSDEGIIQYLYDHPFLAVFLGYPVNPIRLEVSIIDSAHYGRRKKRLGLLPFFIAFVLLVRHLAEQGIIRGRSLILDSSKLPAWYHHDPDARWKDFLKIKSYKIHLVMDHLSLLPLVACRTGQTGRYRTYLRHSQALVWAEGSTSRDWRT